jgi:hypothetical protein
MCLSPDVGPERRQLPRCHMQPMRAVPGGTNLGDIAAIALAVSTGARDSHDDKASVKLSLTAADRGSCRRGQAWSKPRAGPPRGGARNTGLPSESRTDDSPSAVRIAVARRIRPVR